MKALMKTIFATLLASTAITATAQEIPKDASPYYVGANWGARTEYEFGCYTTDCSQKTGRSGKIYGGYTFGSSTLFGMKMTNAVELGVFRISNGSTSNPAVDVNTRDHVAYTGVTASWAPSLNLTENVALNGRLGVAYSHSKWESYLSSPLYSNSSKGSGDRFGPTAGLGMSYAVDRNWRLHADFDYLPVSYGDGRDGKVKMLSVGASYHF